MEIETGTIVSIIGNADHQIPLTTVQIIQEFSLLYKLQIATKRIEFLEGQLRKERYVPICMFIAFTIAYVLK